MGVLRDLAGQRFTGLIALYPTREWKIIFADLMGLNIFLTVWVSTQKVKPLTDTQTMMMAMYVAICDGQHQKNRH